MKASLKFREDQKPLFRAKIPLNILGFPFLSGISGSDSKELCLNLSTYFQSGPSLKVSYRPNDSWNPFSLVVKTGIGSFGSPASSPLAMSADFSLLGGGNPAFFIHFKPQIGDFSIKKIAGSTIKSIPRDPDTDGEESVDGGETPIAKADVRPGKGFFSGDKANGFPTDLRSNGLINDLVSGMEVRATSALPLRSTALLKFRWGVRLPSELADDGRHLRPATSQISLRKIPLLVMSKISIEHVAEGQKVHDSSRPRGCSFRPKNADAAEACHEIRHQLEALRAENGLLGKAVEDISLEIRAAKSTPAAFRQNSGKSDWASRGGDRNGGKFSEPAGKVVEDDGTEALMGGKVPGI